MKRSLFLLWIFGAPCLSAQSAGTGNVWIVAAGIGAYQHDDIMTRLDFTIQGAYEFTRIFEGRQLLGVKPPVLTNQKARRTDIIKAMENTFVKNPEVQADDMILFYFSGHGEIAGGKAGICPWDYSGDVRGLITDEDIQAIMQRSPARYKACFIEACKTEAQSGAFAAPSALESYNRQRRSISGGLVYMTSTRAGEKSWGKPDTGGYFTHFLLRGLEGEANANNDAFITVEELFSFVQSGVRSFSQGKQVPQINDPIGYDPAMPVMVIPSKLRPGDIVHYPSGFWYLAGEMVYVEGGTFPMGDNFKEGDSDEQPVHLVAVPAFYISRHEVSNEQFCIFLNEMDNQAEEGAEWLEIESSYCQIEKNDGLYRPKSGYTNHPVVEVSWYGAAAYCRWLSEKTGKTFRLPTEAEWEYAARERGRKVRFGNGRDIADPAEINFDGRERFQKPYSVAGEYRGETVPVNALAANVLGLRHVSGNVWEWCQDAWHDNYAGAPADGSAWLSGGDPAYRVVRGGAWLDDPNLCRVANRSRYEAPGRGSNIGFRLARPVE